MFGEARKQGMGDGPRSTWQPGLKEAQLAIEIVHARVTFLASAVTAHKSFGRCGKFLSENYVDTKGIMDS